MTTTRHWIDQCRDNLTGASWLLVWPYEKFFRTTFSVQCSCISTSHKMSHNIHNIKMLYLRFSETDSFIRSRSQQSAFWIWLCFLLCDLIDESVDGMSVPVSGVCTFPVSFHTRKWKEIGLTIETRKSFEKINVFSFQFHYESESI